MPRIRAIIEFDGTDFHGWQIQPGCRTVQGVLQDTISQRFNRKIKLYGSGRTDTGVHATGQVAHFNAPVKVDVLELRKSLNGMLPDDIVIKELDKVPVTFHARFHAVSRSYRYEICLEQTALKRRYCWVYSGGLNAARMRRAILSLPGTHDFKPFAKLRSDKSHYRCTIFEASLARSRGRISIRLRGDRFLHGMVRAIVGTLADVGRGTLGEDVFTEIIKSGDRTRVSSLAPACGLCLERVDYRPMDEIRKLL